MGSDSRMWRARSACLESRNVSVGISRAENVSRVLDYGGVDDAAQIANGKQNGMRRGVQHGFEMHRVHGRALAIQRAGKIVAVIGDGGEAPFTSSQEKSRTRRQAARSGIFSSSMVKMTREQSVGK